MSNARQLAANLPREGGLSNRNLIINGDFSVWQRGTSQNTGGYGSVDRWSQHFGGTQTITRLGMTQTRANEIKAACGHIPEYFVSYNVHSFSSYSGFRTRLEDIMKVSGKTVTFSFVAASENGSVLLPKLRIYNTTSGISQDIAASSVTTDSVMRRYEVQVTFADVFTVGSTPDGTGIIEIELYTDRAGWHDYACFQLEVGDTATPFEHRSYGDELARCQRYYWRLNSEGYNTPIAMAQAETTTVAVSVMNLPVRMRATPTFGDSGGTNDFFYYDGGSDVFSGFSGSSSSLDTTLFYKVFSSAAFTDNQALTLRFNDADGYLDWDAEL